MQRRPIKPLILVAILLGSSGCSMLDSLFQEPPVVNKNVVRTATSTCTYLDREHKLHPLYACETPLSYQIQIMGTNHSYLKPLWQANLRAELQRYAKGQPKLAAALPAATIEVWLEAPAFRPDQAYLVAWVRAPSTSLALRLPFVVESWSFTAKSLTYPPRDGDGDKAEVFRFPYQQL